MTMASTDSISYFYEVFSKLGPFKKGNSTPESSDESEVQGTELDIERYTGTSSSSRNSSRKTSPARDKIRDSTSSSLTSSRKTSSTLEPRSSSLYARKSYSDTEGSRHTSPSRYLVKDPFSIKSDTDSSRYDKYDKYDTKFDRKYDKYDTKYDSKYDKYDTKYDKYETKYNSKYDSKYDKVDGKYDKYDTSSRTNLNKSSSFTSRLGATENGSSSSRNPLLKYEIRSYKDSAKSLRSSDYLKTSSQTDISSNRMNSSTTSERSTRSERYSPSVTRRNLTSSTTSATSKINDTKVNDTKPTKEDESETPKTADTVEILASTAATGCALCAQNQKKLDSEMESTKILFRQKGKLEEQVSELKTKLEELEKQKQELETQKQGKGEKQKELENKQKQFEEQQKELENKQKQFEEQQKELENKQKEYEGQQKELENKQKEYEGQQKELENKEKEFDEQQKELVNQQKEFEDKQKELEKQLEESQNNSNNNESVISYNNHALSEEELEELEHLRHENDEMQKQIDKINKQIRKNEKQLEKESLEVRKLTLKLEDANFEKERLRTELIKSQFENEQTIEENEDLAVDNEDLIKERDEILQIYDEVFRECERLKHEVEIWKTVFQANKANLPSDVADNIEDENKTAEKTTDDEGLFNSAWTIEEDPSLLLQPRHDLTIKKSDPAKVFDFSKDEIGRGKFGKLYKAIAFNTGDLYCAKYIKVTQKLHEDVMNSIEVMKKLHHVQLMNLFDVYDLDSQIVMILEHVGGGMLFERIVKNNSLTEADCKTYVKQLLQGIYHMHSQNIVHLEITPENICCVDHNSMQFKLIDFGRAKQLVHLKETKITAGSPEFLAPEILSFDPVSLACDMWSVGVITYVLLSGISPFIGDDDQETLMNVSSGEYEFDEKAFENISSHAKDFIDGLLLSNPKDRRNVTACLSHQWMKIDPGARHRTIDLTRMAAFLKKRKEKPQVSAGRAIRRFSAIAVGPKKPPPMRSASPSPFLNIPNAIDSIAEEEEEQNDSNQKDNDVNINALPSCPIISITNDDDYENNDDSQDGSPAPHQPFENTDSADGLRSYLQRMIDAGHLPGSRGSISSEVYVDDSENEEEEE